MDFKITYRNTNYDSPEDCSLMARWYADPAILHLAVPHRDKASYQKVKSAAEIQMEGKSQAVQEKKIDLIIQEGTNPIGHCTIYFDPGHRLTKEGKVAWFSVTIGESSYRSKGIGKVVIKHLEELAKDEKATHIEIGVFEFNEPSLRMFRALGYQQIGKIDNFTFWDGKFWADIRLLKLI